MPPYGFEIFCEEKFDVVVFSVSEEATAFKMSAAPRSTTRCRHSEDRNPYFFYSSSTTALVTCGDSALHAGMPLPTHHITMCLTLHIPVKATAGQAINLLDGDQQNSSPKWSFIKHSQPAPLTRVRSRFKDPYSEVGGLHLPKNLFLKYGAVVTAKSKNILSLQLQSFKIRWTHMAIAELKADVSRATNGHRIETSTKSVDMLNCCGYQHYTWPDCTCFAGTQSFALQSLGNSPS